MIFPVKNLTAKNIRTLFGHVYGYGGEGAPFTPVSNPHKPPRRVKPGPHRPGETMLYRFTVPKHLLKMEKYGLVVYDSAVWFE